MVRTLPREVRSICVNTDDQGLQQVNNCERLLIGRGIAAGLGSGGDPEIGRRCVEEDSRAIVTVVEGASLVFLAAGLGGGTGTGAAPVAARVAREAGAMVVAFVNMPFEFEGHARREAAEQGLAELERHCDSIVVLANDRMLSALEADASVDRAFALADEALGRGVRAVAELVSGPGAVNVDFSDLKAALVNAGRGHVSSGVGSGADAGRTAAAEALAAPLGEGFNLANATKAIVSVQGGLDLSIGQVSQAVSQVKDRLHPSARIFMGITRREAAGGRVNVTVIATGSAERRAERPVRRTPTRVHVPTQAPMFAMPNIFDFAGPAAG
jgi:cell division protein FtsZ